MDTETIRSGSSRMSGVLDRNRWRSSKGETPEKYSGKNDETFSAFDAKKWKETVARLDKVMVDLEKFVETADDTKRSRRTHRPSRGSARITRTTPARSFTFAASKDRGIRKMAKRFRPREAMAQGRSLFGQPDQTPQRAQGSIGTSSPRWRTRCWRWIRRAALYPPRSPG